MKITDVRIGRFGVWRDLDLPLRSSGLNVFYGPNEAGKTTLLRFLRGVLYGFQPLGLTDENETAHPPEWHGAVRIEQDGRLAEIRRTAAPDGPGPALLSGFDESASPDEQLAQWLGGVGERVFRNVFAIGLHELQELATLNDEEVARHIYGLTLGPEGERLLRAMERIGEERRRLADADEGQLIQLLRQDAAWEAERQPLAELRERHAELCRQRTGVEHRLAELKQQQAAAHLQLRGHLFLERVWGPWDQARQCREELEQLPRVADFPENGLERLDELESEIAAQTDRRDRLRDEARRILSEADALRPDPEVQRHAATMQSFVDQREWLGEVAQQLTAAETRAAQAKAEFDARRAALGPQWTAERLARVDTSSSAHYRLTGMARKYRAALVRRARFKRRALQRSEAYHQRLLQIEERLKAFGGLSADDALQAAQQRLASLEEITRLRSRETELTQRLGNLGSQLDRLEARLALPQWVAAIFGLLAVAGTLAMVVGFVTGVRQNGVAGAMWALLGLTCGGLAWALKTHFSTAVRESIDRLQDEERQDEKQLDELRREIIRLERFENDSPLGRLDAHRATDTERLRLAAQHVAELERLSVEQAEIVARRRRLSESRRRLPAIQREVGAARQHWCELLTQIGLEETVRVDEAFEAWQAVVEVCERRRHWEVARDELHGHRQTWQTWRKRIEDLGHRLGRGEAHGNEPLDVLAAWDDELQQMARRRADRRRLRREARDCRRQAARLAPPLRELATQRSALLVQGGASHREEFEQRAAWAARRRELEDLCELAESELEVARRTQPDLAIVEQDLERYSPEENARRIADLNRELEERESQTLAAGEELGRLKQEIRALEEDDRPRTLDRQRSQVEQQVIEAAERWCALQRAAAAVDQVRAHYERTCQPGVLSAASRYLEQLTRGRYRTIWTPLGQQHLRLEDGRGRTLRVEQLSNGTREQMFLAVRLALVRQFAQEGIELPLVLDDILVNFDQLRTEAAVETLMQLAEGGQQILLFTCHLHLAHLFESRGIEPTWLPGHHAAREERMAG